MPIQFKCTACRKPVQVSSKLMGSSVPCPLCHEIITVPSIQAQPPVSPPIHSAAPPQQDPTPPAARTGPEVLFSGCSSQLTNVGAFACTSIFALLGAAVALTNDSFPAALIVLGAGGLIICLAYLNVKSRHYTITTDRIEMETGIVSKQIDTMDLFRAKDLRYYAGVFDRLYGLGNIAIASSDSSHPVLHVRGIPDARRLYDRLKEEVHRADRKRGVVYVES